MTVRSESSVSANASDEAIAASTEHENLGSKSGPTSALETEISVLSDPSSDSPQPLDKVCPKCSVRTRTAGAFCPQCGAPYAGHRRGFKVSRRVILIILAVLVVVGAAVGILVSVQHTNQLNAEKAAAVQAADVARKREADAAKTAADAAASADAAAAAKATKDDAERAVRAIIVKALEGSVLKDAKSRVTDGTLMGPISSASCTPVGGGSTDDLTAITGTFECIAVNKTDADGSSSGYRFSGTANWNDGSYS
ncbi:hypothetical protein IV498_15665 [Paenarthrobacter sp. Z7-10]|uniref:hypothetical protein n=1 Tax=Paenarthrobacter sp. Z7-10 TaxID=2787635 RepID=UPI0022A962E5|nr:hypothetical protein [Paenarthrobacter sp. Z7-10]MCZ2404575.1 hypothetical protein [Paenarthrobacter sp. Z7-10]